MGTTETLAKFVVETPSSTIPNDARESAKTSLMDAVGTALTAHTQPLGKIITEFVDQTGGTGISRVIGTSIKTSAPQAALANGTLGHADDYDDVGGFGHPAVILMPTVLALGEMLHKSGKEVLDAYVLGYEVGARLSPNLGANHYSRGWHSTVTIGTMASAAAAARLMGLDVEKTRMALGIAASQAGGVIANFGTMTKPFHPGNGARSGVVAALLADMGLTSNPDIIEARQGYGAAFSDPSPNFDGMTEKLATEWRIISMANIKEWPCCYGNHAAIPMALRLVEKYEFEAEDVAEIHLIQPGAGGVSFLNRPNIDTYFGGKFSLQFNIAAPFVDKEVTYESFADESVNRPEIQDLMKKVKLLNKGEAIDASVLEARQRPTELAVYLKDGRRLSEEEAGITNSLRGSQVDSKFQSNAGRILPQDKVSRSNSVLRDLENVRDVVEVMDSVTLGN